MKSMIVALTLALVASTAMAADLNISVEALGGGNAIEVEPGALVEYQIVGELSDMDHQGLALFSLDLEFDGGALPQADAPTAAPMTNFDRNLGITNPAGYGGTDVGGILRQIGGGQNTINNPGPPDYPEFPVAETIILNVATQGSPEVLATGSFTAPMTEGTYNLMASDVVANVVKTGETGDPFWAVEAATPGMITNLVITVALSEEIQIVGSTPVDGAIDARRPFDPNDPGTTFGWSSIELDFDGDVSGLVPADFMLTENPAGALTVDAVNVVDADTVEVVFSGQMMPVSWLTIEHIASATSVMVGYLPADANQDAYSDPFDVLALVDHLNGIVLLPEPYATDTDRSGVTDSFDILEIVNLLNGAGDYPVFKDVGLP
jgi:hypothetical protein